jgi:hypothetical protein
MYKFIENYSDKFSLEIGKKYIIISDSNFVNPDELYGVIAIADEDKGNGWYIMKRLDNNQYELISPLSKIVPILF